MVVTVYLAGVMLEYDVIQTALDAVTLGHPTVVLTDTVWSKDSRQEEVVMERLRKSNVIMADSDEVYGMLNGRERRLETGYILAQRLYRKYRYRF